MRSTALQITPLVNSMKRFRRFPEDARKAIIRELWEHNPYTLTLLKDTIEAVLHERVQPTDYKSRASGEREDEIA